jgi:hypothetical protein
MFDHLVETRRQRNERSTPVLVATATIYCAALGAAALVAVFYFNPQLSEASPKVVIYTTPIYDAEHRWPQFLQSVPLTLRGPHWHSSNHSRQHYTNS